MSHKWDTDQIKDCQLMNSMILNENHWHITSINTLISTANLSDLNHSANKSDKLVVAHLWGHPFFPYISKVINQGQMPTKLNITNSQIIDSITTYFDGQTEITTAALREWCNVNDYTYSTIRNRLIKDGHQSGRGKFDLNTAKQVLETSYDAPAAAAPSVGSVQTATQELDNLVPDNDDTFVPFGNFKDVKAIIKSKVFYPLFITGLSGNGKTHGVEQACAQLGREVVRVNVTIETDD